MEKTKLLFLFACVPMRILEIVAVALIMEPSISKDLYDPFRFALIFILAFQSIGFFYSDLTKREYGAFGNKRWWNSAAHGAFFLAACLGVIFKLEETYVILIFDFLFGLWGWYVKYYIN